MKMAIIGGDRTAAAIASYQPCGENLAAFLVERGITSPVGSVTREHLEAFFAEALDRLAPPAAAKDRQDVPAVTWQAERMASVRRDIFIEARPDDVWAAVADFGAPHERLVPGFVVECRLDGTDRIVTFFNGAVAREAFVDSDDEQRRLVWSVTESGLGLTHHNASAQVLAEPDGGTRFVWITDLLPHEAAVPIGQMMDRGIEVLKHTLETHPRSRAGA
jgi:Polyketide cyclase / dehydrase and lipid transport